MEEEQKREEKCVNPIIFVALIDIIGGRIVNKRSSPPSLNYL
jgi:hypothetical protein